MTKQEFLRQEREQMIAECYKTGVAAVHISRVYTCTKCGYQTKAPEQIYDHKCVK